MNASDDFDAETRAHRIAMDAYARVLEEELGPDRIFRLAGTQHHHRTMCTVGDDRVVVISIVLDFSRLATPDELRELSEQASRAPGSVPEA